MLERADTSEAIDLNTLALPLHSMNDLRLSGLFEHEHEHEHDLTSVSLHDKRSIGESSRQDDAGPSEEFAGYRYRRSRHQR